MIHFELKINSLQFVKPTLPANNYVTCYQTVRYDNLQLRSWQEYQDWHCMANSAVPFILIGTSKLLTFLQCYLLLIIN